MQTKGPADIDLLTQALTYLNSEREVFKVLVNSSPDNSFTDRLFQRPLLTGILQDQIVKNYSPEQIAYVGLFFSHGIYAMVRQWLNSENPPAPQDIAKLILSLRQRFA